MKLSITRSCGRVLKAAMYDLLPVPLRIQGGSFFTNLMHDARDILARRVDNQVPPRCLNVSGNGPFLHIGRQNLELCQETGLKADDTILDLGCGIGRTALAMKDYLTAGSYVGLDIIDFAIKWCKQHIQKQHPNFSFVHADVFNRTYNPGGRIAPERYQLPFDSLEFDYGLATSLFTHTLPATTENYLREVGRVLRPGATFLSTWFLLDGETELVSVPGAPLLPFKHRFHHYALNDINAPEQAVAYQLKYVQNIFAAAGLTVDRIGRGSWSGTAPDAKYGQDVIVAHRSGR